MELRASGRSRFPLPPGRQGFPEPPRFCRDHLLPFRQAPWGAGLSLSDVRLVACFPPRSAPMDRRAIAISGIVQGVGFRPYVFGLATRLRLVVHQEPRRRGPHRSRGRAARPRSFPGRADDEAAAVVPDRRHARLVNAPARGDPSFQIKPSDVTPEPIFISPDVATCDDCLPSCSIPATGATATRSSTAPTAARA